MNGFVWSLRAMGYDVRVNDPSWERKHMTSMPGYEELKGALDRYPDDIEPYWDKFPEKPRLTRRWWDHEFIYASEQAAKKAREEKH
jgi:hypothetical protein